MGTFRQRIVFNGLGVFEFFPALFRRFTVMGVRINRHCTDPYERIDSTFFSLIKNNSEFGLIQTRSGHREFKDSRRSKKTGRITPPQDHVR